MSKIKDKEGILKASRYAQNVPGSSAGQEFTCNVSNPGSIPGSRNSLWRKDRLATLVFLGSLGGSDGKQSACNVGDLQCGRPAMWETGVRSLGWEDPLEEGMATHFSIVVWGNPTDRGAWWATVHGIAKSWT